MTAGTGLLEWASAVIDRLYSVANEILETG